MAPLLRKGHFLGAKLRSLRKRNGLTLEELSARCIQTRCRTCAVGVLPEHDRERQARALIGDARAAGRRCSSATPAWFLDESADLELPTPATPSGGAAKVPLEPAFLFSKDVLQAAIPELLAQTGTSGRQFAHLLIRSHQEMSRNDFPDLERAADGVGEPQLSAVGRRSACACASSTASRSAGSSASRCSPATRTARCAAWCAPSSSRRVSSMPTARCNRIRRG